MRMLLLFCFLCFSLHSLSQKTVPRPPHPPAIFKKHRHHAAVKKTRQLPVVTKGFYLSFNLNSILEPEQGAVGLGAGYRFNKRFEAFSEINYLYQGFYDKSDERHFNNLKGFRSINSFKYFYSKRHGFFVGVDFRIKAIFIQ